MFLPQLETADLHQTSPDLQSLVAEQIRGVGGGSILSYSFTLCKQPPPKTENI